MEMVKIAGLTFQFHFYVFPIIPLYIRIDLILIVII